MFESFIIMLREGIEAALVVGITLVVLRKANRRDLEKPVYWGLGLAVLASIVAAALLHLLHIDDDATEGPLYLVSAVFVASMMVWMHRKGKSVKRAIEQRVQRVAGAGGAGAAAEAWGLGSFIFLMVFREGAEAVVFLTAVDLTTQAMLSFVGAVLGLAAAVVFAVLFVRGSIAVNLRRFFVVTEWVLAIFLVQLVISGYHEMVEAGFIPATQRTMAFIGPIVHNNDLFILAMVAIPLFIWLSGETGVSAAAEPVTGGRLARAANRRQWLSSAGAVASIIAVASMVGVGYVKGRMPESVLPPTVVAIQNDAVTIPLSQLADGHLHRWATMIGNTRVRFLAIKAPDGRIHTALDACHICGTIGYIESNGQLVCLNCGAGINPDTVGVTGRCHPIPLKSKVAHGKLYIARAQIQRFSHLFANDKHIQMSMTRVK